MKSSTLCSSLELRCPGFWLSENSTSKSLRKIWGQGIWAQENEWRVKPPKSWASNTWNQKKKNQKLLQVSFYWLFMIFSVKLTFFPSLASFLYVVGKHSQWTCPISYVITATTGRGLLLFFSCKLKHLRKDWHSCGLLGVSTCLRGIAGLAGAVWWGRCPKSVQVSRGDPQHNVGWGSVRNTDRTVREHISVV